MTRIITRKTYEHYNNLPRFLKDTLNVVRTNVFDYVEGNCDVNFILDENDLEFIALDKLVSWVNKTLPEFDQLCFLEAAARIHKETYEDGLFDSFMIEGDELFEVLLLLKDEYELLKEKEGE